MKTGEFIQMQYEREIVRIKSELLIAEKKIREEKEILELQSRIKLHQSYREGAMVIHFNCSGAIGIAFDKGNMVWLDLLIVHHDTQKKFARTHENLLNELHLKQLKSIQPKRAVELVRMMAKKYMLIEEEMTIAKKWWEFWK